MSAPVCAACGDRKRRWSQSRAARSSTSTWMRSTHRSSSATIRSCAESRSRSAVRANAASSPPRAMRPGEFGVRSAMPSVTARRKCPELIFVKPRFEVYRQVSMQMRAIFAEYTPIIEPLSLDEAYLDVTENLLGLELGDRNRASRSARGSARRPTSRPRPACPTTSFSQSSHRIIASPTGCSSSRRRWGRRFVETLPVRKFHGVGPATAAKMMRLGIETGLDLKARPLAWSAGAIRQIRSLLLLDRARHRRKAGSRRPDSQVCRRGEHLRRRPLHLRCGLRRAGADRGQGLALLRERRDARADRHAESQICGFPADHAKPDRRRPRRDARRAGTAEPRVARACFSGGKRRPASRPVIIVAERRANGCEAAIEPSVVVSLAL